MRLLTLGLVSLMTALPAAAVERESSWVVPDLMFVDSDADGIADQNDQCASTGVGTIVGATGCSLVVERAGGPGLNINFDFDSAVIQPEFLPVLADFAEVLKQEPGLGVELSGHTDQLGTEAYNQGLSEARALAVQDALVNQFSVPAQQLFVVGYSESQPLIQSDDIDTLRMNRRVQAGLIDLVTGEQFISDQTIKTSN